MRRAGVVTWFGFQDVGKWGRLPGVWRSSRSDRDTSSHRARGAGAGDAAGERVGRPLLPLAALPGSMSAERLARLRKLEKKRSV